MPDSMETSYTDWVGRKHAKLKRSTLDCGHANPGDVHYHYWCDRLSCSAECANAGHDCGLFKGKSGSEEEAVEPEAVVDPPTPRPLTLSPETYRALYGPPEPTGAPILAVTTPGDPWSDIVDTYQHVRDSQGDRQPFFTPALDAEAERLETEIRLRLNALTPIAADLPAPWVSITDEGIGRFHDDPGAHPVDAALQPDPNALRHAVSREEIQQLWDQMVDWPEEPEPDEPVDVHRYECPHSRCDWTKVTLDRDLLLDLAEAHELQAHAPRPWWRRYLPGGTR